MLSDMIILLISILVYLLSVIGGFFIILHEVRQLCHTVGDVLDIMMDSPFFMPIVNTLFLIIWGIMYVVTSLKIHLPFVKLWSKFKNIKIK